MPGHWYGKALANKLVGADLDPATPDINANFNVNLGQPGCLTGIFFYLGLDNNHGNNVDLVTVLTHEFGHGLGFSDLYQWLLRRADCWISQRLGRFPPGHQHRPELDQHDQRSACSFGPQ